MVLHHAMTREELLNGLLDYTSMAVALMNEQAEKPDPEDKIYNLIEEALYLINEELDKLEQPAKVTS